MMEDEQKVSETVSAEVLVGASAPRRASLLVKFVVGLLIVCGILWILSALQEKGPAPVVMPDGVTQEMTETGAAFDTFESVMAGGKTYALRGVSFVFEPQVDEAGSATTRVRLQLDGLTRSGVAIAVAPYRLGTYRGSCKTVSADEARAIAGNDRLLAASECVSGELVRRIAVTQSATGADQGQIIVRVASSGLGQSEEPVSILNIDVAAIPR